jgi:ubiquinone/menaquinone biosynthesis C-methylase UbiE
VDTSFAMDTMLKEVGGTDIFRGLGSLVDVGGGHGAAAMAIARAFPDVKCSVLDLEQVISKVAAASDGAVQFIAGDMFESIPPADAVFLKVRT